MPIKPDNLKRYPADWPAVRAAIRERAQHRCEWPGCGARQYAVGFWLQRRGAWCWRPAYGSPALRAAGRGLAWPSLMPWSWSEARAFAAGWHVGDQLRPVVIVLTVAHLDHQPEHCAPENLRAWCQRHHLAHDRALHTLNAYMTRRDRAQTGEMFDLQPIHRTEGATP